MEGLLSIVNKLQKLINLSHVKVDISLPQIVVVGAQSAGKSSVLESIIGKDFLPRGSGIVTRLPLIIQCHNSEEEFAIFQHKSDARFTDFTQVRDEIIAETNKKAGNNKRVLDEPILLEIYSPKVVNITLVDLPGLTKNPVGDQPRNISTLIEQMVLEYINKENAIILAISPGNNDIANSDALKIARDVDPKGERTLGVITKLDLMDKGTSAMNVLLGEEYPLNHGYVGVICRSQEDINNNVSISDHLAKEAEFFSTHPDYKTIQDQTGIPYLTQRLQEILFEKLNKTLPSIKEGIDRQLLEKTEESKKYGEAIGDNKNYQKNVITKVVDEYHRYLEDALEGRMNENLGGTDITGAKIRQLLFSFFEDKLRKINPEISDEKIAEKIENANGIYGTLLIPDQAFREIAQSSIESLREPCFMILDKVRDVLSNLTKNIKNPYFFRFKNLQHSICEITERVIEEKCQKTQEMIEMIFYMESHYININHPDFMGKLAIEKVNKRIEEAQNNVSPFKQPESLFGKPSTPTQNGGQFMNPQVQASISSPINKTPAYTQGDQKSIEIIKLLMKSYFGIVRKNIGDNVPKAIFSFLIHDVKYSLREALYQELSDDKLGKLLDEGKVIPRKREDCKEAISLLRNAKTILRSWDIFNI